MALAFKIGSLLVKQLAKPVSTRFQSWVLSHPTTRQYAIAAGQWLHRAEIMILRGAEGKFSKAFIADMTEEKSLEYASKVASEGFVLAVGVSLVLFEYQRQKWKEADKSQKEHKEKMAIMENARLERERLSAENREQQELIQRLMFRVDSLEDKIKALSDEAMARHAKRKGLGWLMGGFSSATPAMTDAAAAPAS